MSDKKITDNKKTKNRGAKTELNPFLQTQKSHKKWYEPREMGKQRGRPRILKEQKKAAGSRHHHLRKEV